MANNTSMAFDIDEDDYQTFLEDLREELSHTSDVFCLLEPANSPLSWLDVHFISADYSINFRIERMNMYVRGYSTNGDIDFWEFSDSSLIPGSRSLSYCGSFFGIGGLCKTAGVERHELPLGYSALQDAISNLAVIVNPDSDQELSARSLLTIIQMIVEAAKIPPIIEHIVSSWRNPEPITLEMVSLQNTWGTFSNVLHSVHSAARAGTIVLTPDTPLPIRALRIRTLVSIEYLRVNNIDDETPGQLYGSVMVNDCWGDDHTVYDRSSNDSESKQPGEYVSLTGPSMAINGEDAFIISVSLSDHDDEIAKEEIVWDSRSRDSSYDKPLQEDVSGKHGSVSVGYSVITEALSATISVVMVNGDKESPALVYGTIKASRVLGESSTTRILFHKSANECVNVSPQQSIPLTRPVFPVPVNSCLTIEANFWDHDSDHQIAGGSVKFTPMIGTQKKKITGEHGEVEVSITCE